MQLRVPIGALSAFLFGESITFDDLDEQARRRIRAAQLDAVVQLVPLTMTINILNAAIVVGVFWGSDANVVLAVWGAMILLAAGTALWSWRRSRHKRPTGASPQAIHRAVVHAALLGTSWGAAALILFPRADLMHQLVLGCLMAGMISGGAFCLSTVPRAGMTYTATTVIGSVAALLLSGREAFVVIALLLVFYAVFISRNLLVHGALFVRHLREQMQVETQREVIGLLLNDFQQHASDWLWETDAKGALVHVSERFAEAAGQTKARLQGTPFSDVIGGQSGDRTANLAEIFKRIAAHAAFRDLAVPVEIGADRRYWRLAGKPMFDAAGAFCGYRGVAADVTEKRLADERIIHLARYDTLTGLPNRSYFHDMAARALGEARADGRVAALLCVNLDQFKSVNDTLGHVVGDALLKLVGYRLRSCVRDRDLVARIGGDEFAILQITDALPIEAMVLTRQIIDAFRQPFKLEHGDLSIDVSLGIAVTPADGWAVDALLKKADLALFAAKAEGAANYRFFEPDMEAGAHRRRALEMGLRAAIDNGELALAFQPLLDLRSGCVTGCEALLRWTSREWGVVSPAEFIPVAEATGLIESIGEWVLREAVRTARQWPADTVVAVNLSPVQFKSQKLMASVVSALAESGLPPRRLELEVTESIFIDGSEHAYGMLQNLRSLGIRTSLDDFGTGYSSLSYLRRFPFDKIKIDKTFIDDVAVRHESAAIIRAIVTLAEALGMTTTAEGVESPEQVAKLREVGCTQIQGYVVSRPRPAKEIAAMLARSLDMGEGAATPPAKMRAVAG